MPTAKKLFAIFVLVVIGSIVGIVLSTSSSDITESIPITIVVPSQITSQDPSQLPSQITPQVPSQVLSQIPSCKDTITTVCLNDLWTQDPNKCSEDITKYYAYINWLSNNIPYDRIVSDIQFLKTSSDEESTEACHGYISPNHPPNPKFETENIPTLDRREYLSSELTKP